MFVSYLVEKIDFHDSVVVILDCLIVFNFPKSENSTPTWVTLYTP